jgi:hypothetical protein
MFMINLKTAEISTSKLFALVLWLWTFLAAIDMMGRRRNIKSHSQLVCQKISKVNVSKILTSRAQATFTKCDADVSFSSFSIVGAKATKFPNHQFLCLTFHVFFSFFRSESNIPEIPFSKMWNVMWIIKSREGVDRCELTQNFHLHWFLRCVIVLISSRAQVGALIGLSLDIFNGQRAIWDTLSHVCGQLDVILTSDRERKDNKWRWNN